MLVLMSCRWPWVVGFGTTFYLLTRVALTVTDEDVKNSSASLCIIQRCCAVRMPVQLLGCTTGSPGKLSGCQRFILRERYLCTYM